MGRKTGLYKPLKNELIKSGQNKVTLTFGKIEEILERDLPKSARNYREWWGNCSSNPQAREGWMDAGYEVAALYKTKIKDENGEDKEVYYKVDFVKILKDSDNTRTVPGDCNQTCEKEVKKCISCSQPINKGFVFCPYCGAKQIKECPNCGTIVKEDFKFCPNCGKELDETKNA